MKPTTEWGPEPAPSFFVDGPRPSSNEMDLWGFVKTLRSDDVHFTVPILVPAGTKFNPHHPAVAAAVEECRTYLNCACRVGSICDVHAGRG
jgi:hypothetical protein